MTKLDYQSAGVDLQKYQDAMQRLPKWMHRTFSPRVIPRDGGFAGLFQLDFANPLFARNYQDPVLLAGTDGVGTKLQVASRAGRHDTVGIDLVAMCVNDVLCCGGEVLFFLDYVAMSRDNPPLLEEIVKGISDGCLQAQCALLGGETAIMPDLYQGDDYDLAGFCVGVADRARLIDGKAIKPGNVVLGVASSGLHSNGFSLVRKIVFEKAQHDIDDYIEALGATVADALLCPTRIYARPLRQVAARFGDREALLGIAHVTGGGLVENLSRILPADVDTQIDHSSWSPPPIFAWLQRLGNVEDAEMRRVFNMGIGLALVVDESDADEVSRVFTEAGFENWPVGRVGKND